MQRLHRSRWQHYFAFATSIAISVFQDVNKEFDQSVDNNHNYFSSTIYATLDEAGKVIVQGNHYVIPSCPRQCPSVNDVPDGVVYLVGKKVHRGPIVVDGLQTQLNRHDVSN